MCIENSFLSLLTCFSPIKSCCMQVSACSFKVLAGILNKFYCTLDSKNASKLRQQFLPIFIFSWDLAKRNPPETTQTSEGVSGNLTWKCLVREMIHFHVEWKNVFSFHSRWLYCIHDSLLSCFKYFVSAKYTKW